MTTINDQGAGVGIWEGSLGCEFLRGSMCAEGMGCGRCGLGGYLGEQGRPPIQTVSDLCQSLGDTTQLSREEVGMAVYCEQDIHATNIRGGPVLVTHRDGAIEISRRTVCAIWRRKK